MIAVIDYGVGNLRSVQKALEKVGQIASITSNHSDILSSDGVVLPGVGAFGDGMASLCALGLDEVVREVAAMGKPLLGVCLGLQLLFTESEETFGDADVTPGLDIIQGRIVRFPCGMLKVPQIGWNTAVTTPNSRLFNGIPNGSFFYFVHSYYALPSDASVVSTWTEYGVRFASSIQSGLTFAAQFHPEKSSTYGLAIYANFGRVVEECS